MLVPLSFSFSSAFSPGFSVADDTDGVEEALVELPAAVDSALSVPPPTEGSVLDFRPSSELVASAAKVSAWWNYVRIYYHQLIRVHHAVYVTKIVTES